MPFNIDSFQSQVMTRGVLPTNKFQVTFNLPPAFASTDPNFSDYYNMTRDEGMWIDGASVPSVMLSTVPIRRYGYGQIEKRAVVTGFTDVQLRVIIDGSAMMWDLFRRWIQKIDNFDESQGMFADVGQTTTESSAGYVLQTYEGGYPDDYTTNFVISVYNPIGGEQKRIILNQAYPSALSDINLSWDNNNALGRFSVNISMQDWWIDQSTSAGPAVILAQPLN